MAATAAALPSWPSTPSPRCHSTQQRSSAGIRVNFPCLTAETRWRRDLQQKRSAASLRLRGETWKNLFGGGDGRGREAERAGARGEPRHEVTRLPEAAEVRCCAEH